MPKLHTHYENLKVARSAPTEVIRAAYRALAQKYHPDVNATPGSARVMQLLNEAWEVLSDPRRRAEHDAWIAEQEAAFGRAQPPRGTDPVGSSPPPQQTYTYTYTYSKPSSSPGTRGRREPRPTESQPDSASAARRATPPNPLVRLNAWLGTPDGKTYAWAAVLAAVLAAWVGPSLFDRMRPQSTSGVPNSNAAYRPTSQERLSPPSASKWQPPSEPAPWEKDDIVASPSSAKPALSQTRSTPVAGSDQPLHFVPLQGSSRWSPTGKPWPTSAGYLSGLKVRASGGLSKLTIDNTNGGSDVYVKLCAVSREKCDGYRHVFIPQGSSFTMNGVARGAYDIRYRDLETGQIAKSDVIPLTQTDDERGTRFSVVRLTLYRVQGGNTNFTPLTEDQF